MSRAGDGMRRIQRDNTGLLRPGQDLVVAGFAGLAGTWRIVKERKEELLERFSASYLDRILDYDISKTERLLTEWRTYGAAECEPSGFGGILKTLWDLSGAYMTGICFCLRDIPIKQETVEICERYDLNPYRLLSTGCYLLAVDNGGELVRELKKDQLPAAVIGKVTEGVGRVIEHEEGRGFLDRPTEDELHKIIL